MYLRIYDGTFDIPARQQARLLFLCRSLQMNQNQVALAQRVSTLGLDLEWNGMVVGRVWAKEKWAMRLVSQLGVIHE